MSARSSRSFSQNTKDHTKSYPPVPNHLRSRSASDSSVPSRDSSARLDHNVLGVQFGSRTIPPRNSLVSRLSGDHSVSKPVNVRHVIHVEWNEELQAYTGIPDVWGDDIPQSRLSFPTGTLPAHINPRADKSSKTVSARSRGGSSCIPLHILQPSVSSGPSRDYLAEYKAQCSIEKDLHSLNISEVPGAAPGPRVFPGPRMHFRQPPFKNPNSILKVSVRNYLVKLGFDDLDREYRVENLREMLMERLSLPPERVTREHNENYSDHADDLNDVSQTETVSQETKSDDGDASHESEDVSPLPSDNGHTIKENGSPIDDDASDSYFDREGTDLLINGFVRNAYESHGVVPTEMIGLIDQSYGGLRYYREIHNILKRLNELKYSCKYYNKKEREILGCLQDIADDFGFDNEGIEDEMNQDVTDNTILPELHEWLWPEDKNDLEELAKFVSVWEQVPVGTYSPQRSLLDFKLDQAYCRITRNGLDFTFGFDFNNPEYNDQEMALTVNVGNADKTVHFENPIIRGTGNTRPLNRSYHVGVRIDVPIDDPDWQSIQKIKGKRVSMDLEIADKTGNKSFEILWPKCKSD
eukprot:196355_1